MTHPQLLLAAILVLAVGFLSGCNKQSPIFVPYLLSTDRDAAFTVTPTSTPIPSPTPNPLPLATIKPSTPASSGPSETEAVDLAQHTLAEHLGTDPEDLQVQRVLATEWPDASLGCPEKGMMYAQVVIPGYRVWLLVGDQSYDVHVGDGRAVVCTREAKAPPSNEIAVMARLYELARQDLAARLNIDVTLIEGQPIRQATWPNAGLGCPEPGTSYPQVKVEGFIIELVADQKTFEYHADRERVVLCETH